MKHIATSGKRKMFEVLLESSSIQAAMMVLAPGKSSGEEVTDEHPKSEQWLFVISGSGRAIGKHRSFDLKAGSLLLITQREPHKITNTGKVPLKTINFYAPPAYTADGEVKRV